MRAYRSIGLVAILCAALAVCLGACGGSDKSSTVASGCKPKYDVTTAKKGQLTVAAAAYAPYSMPAAGNAVTGIDADVLNQIAKELCLTVVANNTPIAASITGVQSGRFDTAIGGFVRTETRDKVVGQSDPITRFDFGFTSKSGIESLDDLDGKTLGGAQGIFLNPFFEQILGGRFHQYPTTDDAYQDLNAGRLDAVVDSLGAGAWAVKQGKVPGGVAKIIKADARIPATQEIAQTDFPYSKDNQALGDAMNKIIAEMHSNGRITAIVQKYGLPAVSAEPGTPSLAAG